MLRLPYINIPHQLYFSAHFCVLAYIQRIRKFFVLTLYYLHWKNIFAHWEESNRSDALVNVFSWLKKQLGRLGA